MLLSVSKSISLCAFNCSLDTKWWNTHIKMTLPREGGCLSKERTAEGLRRKSTILECGESRQGEHDTQRMSQNNEQAGHACNTENPRYDARWALWQRRWGSTGSAESKWTLGIREEPREANFPEGPGGLRDAPSRWRCSTGEEQLFCDYLLSSVNSYFLF